jgi:hypothetical protein
MIRVYAIILLLLMTGCTTSRWVANSEPKLDFSSSRELDSNPRISVASIPTPSQPVLEISVVNERLLEVPLVYESSRVIQRYIPRTGFLIAGILASAGTLYLSEKVDSESSNGQKNLFRITAGGILIGSALNMKPDGDPIRTGESRIYGQSSRTQFVDSTQTYRLPVLVRMNAALDGVALLSGREFNIRQNVKINLLEELNLSNRQLEHDASIAIQLVTEHEIIDLEVPVSSLMNRFIYVTQRNTVVRTQPEVNSSNIITTIAPNSYLPFIEQTENGWFRTILGASTAYIPETAGKLVWRVGSGFNSDLIVSTSGVQPGSVDIERNVPEIDSRNPNSIAIIITQESYSQHIRSVKNAHRGGDLVNEYVTKSLGIPDQNVIRLRSSYFPESIRDILTDTGSSGMYQFENKDLFFYYSGAGARTVIKNQVQFELISTDENRSISLTELFGLLSGLPVRNTTVILDTDFSNVKSDSVYFANQDVLLQKIDSYLNAKQNSAVFLATDLNQIASNYQSQDLRTDRIHGVFTYYFLQSIQNGLVQLPQIRDNLLRNVTFTSRRLHNRGQDPIIRFNSNYSLIPQD